MNTLPKYFVIKRDENNPLWDRYIKWLNETYKENFGGSTCGYKYYGFDGKADCWSEIKYFQNNPKLITLEQWDEAVNSKEFQPQWGDEVEVSDDGEKWKAAIYIALNPNTEHKNKYIVCNLHNVFGKAFIRPTQTVALTRQQIADKFGIDVNNLKIEE